jgi:hypothetical protein
VLIPELQEKDKHTAEITSSMRAFRVELHFPLLKKESKLRLVAKRISNHGHIWAILKTCKKNYEGV